MKTLTKQFTVSLIFGLCTLITTVPAFSQNQGLTEEHVAKMQTVYNAEISDDGDYIAYLVMDQADPTKQNKPASMHLYVYNANTEESVAYYKHSSVGEVSFRPGHQTITFTSQVPHGKGNALFEMPIKGGGATQLYQFETKISGYNWGPEGNKLVFTANKPTDQEANKLPYEPNIKEEGLIHQKAYTINIENKDEEEAQPLQTEGSVYITKWSPDGDQIAISTAPTPLVDDYYMSQSVKIASANSREIVANIDNAGKLSDIQWSPDGDQIALLAGNDINDVIAGRIMVADAEDGAEPKNIRPDFKGRFEQIDWTSGNTIHFIASESTKSGFGTIRPDGSNLDYELGLGGPIYDNFSYANDRRIAFVANQPSHPGEVYYKRGKGDPERISNSNPWLDDVAMGEQTTVTYNARDGKKIEGVLIKPVGYDGGEVPTIVSVHGGPEAHYSNGWVTRYSDPGQVGAAKGYAVFYPNYRGSTGRGMDYLKSSQGDAAGAEFDDIVDGVDHLIDQGIANEDKVGVTGGSYGGYASGWMATRYSDRFAASVMFVGISDNISKWGTTDIPQEMYLVHAREWIWEDNNWMKYLKRSPIYHVDKAKTPILITYGEEDTRVHPGQSMELFRHIKVRKPEVPVRLVGYPNEGHGNRNASARYDYNIRMMRWFDTFLIKDKEEKPDRNIGDSVEMD